MTHRIWLVGLALLLSESAFAQTNGMPTQLDLTGGNASLTLDFATHNYELILYSGQTEATDTTLAYSYSVAYEGASKWAVSDHAHVPISDRDHLESQLRARERALARRLQTEDGWAPSVRKTAAQQIGATRSFAFEKFGGVTSDHTVAATLVATSTRAIGYLDNALPASIKNITTSQIQTMLDQFSSGTYPLVTNAFGAASDVDSDGKVIFLFIGQPMTVTKNLANFFSSFYNIFPTGNFHKNTTDMSLIYNTTH